MADLFVTIFSVVPKPSTITPGGTQLGNQNVHGLFTVIQRPQVITPGNKK